MSMLFPRHKHPKTLKVLACVACVILAGQSACLNPAFMNQMTGGRFVPLAPGDTPFIHVLVINATSNWYLDFLFGWTPQFQGYNTASMGGIGPQQQRGLLLGCPIEQIGLGNPGDLSEPAMIITTENGDINVPPSAFPLVLQRGRDFDCGDTVVLTVIEDRNSGYGVRILPGRVPGGEHTGPFTGPDTFEIVQALLLGAGTPPVPVP